jgi:hypothetical protein
MDINEKKKRKNKGKLRRKLTDKAIKYAINRAMKKGKKRKQNKLKKNKGRRMGINANNQLKIDTMKKLPKFSEVNKYSQPISESSDLRNMMTGREAYDILSATRTFEKDWVYANGPKFRKQLEKVLVDMGLDVSTVNIIPPAVIGSLVDGVVLEIIVGVELPAGYDKKFIEDFDLEGHFDSYVDHELDDTNGLYYEVVSDYGHKSKLSGDYITFVL